MYTKNDIINNLRHSVGDIILLPETDSTNNYIKKNFRSIKHSSIVIAEKQTTGRGRRGRSFLSPEGGLYMSVLLKPDKLVLEDSMPTIAAAVAVSRALKNVYNVDCTIKWVNDIYISGKKLCGILCESSSTENYVIIGIGINIRRPADDFHEEIKDIACALDEFTDKIDVSPLIAEIFNGIVDFAPDFHPARFIDEYRDRSCVTGKRITVIKDGRLLAANALKITDSGSLLVEYEDKTKEELFYGDISLKL